MKLISFALLFTFLATVASAGSIGGQVVDEDGSAVPFVTVYIEGTTIGTTTNSEGNYHLDLKDGFYTIVFRYVGFKTEAKGVTVAGKTQLAVILKRVVFQLGEAQIDGNEDPCSFRRVARCDFKCCPH